MNNVTNNYHGPVNMQGTNFQSHYVPAEKPYAVYAYVWDDNFAIAQLIGTMLVGEPDKDGDMQFNGKGVFRMSRQNGMLYFDHCFMPQDMANLDTDPEFLGFVGDTISKERFVEMVKLELTESIDMGVKEVMENMRMAGLKVESFGVCDLPEVCGDFTSKVFANGGKSHDLHLVVCEGVALCVILCDKDGKSVPARKVLDKLWIQIHRWEEVGVTFGRIKMPVEHAEYQAQVAELLELARIYGKYEVQGRGCQTPYDLMQCREYIGTDRCFYEDFVMGIKKVHYSDYASYDADLEWAVRVGLVSRNGNIIQFSEDMERMAAWKWEKAEK